MTFHPPTPSARVAMVELRDVNGVLLSLDVSALTLIMETVKLVLATLQRDDEKRLKHDYI